MGFVWTMKTGTYIVLRLIEARNLDHLRTRHNFVGHKTNIEFTLCIEKKEKKYSIFLFRIHVQISCAFSRSYRGTHFLSNIDKVKGDKGEENIGFPQERLPAS